MSRCELHTDGPLGNQCERAAVLTLQALVGQGVEARSEFTAAACSDHAWEATARAAQAVCRARALGDEDARVLALVEPAGAELLKLLQGGITVGDRWPLAKPWARR